jgi:hypothetical protein
MATTAPAPDFSLLLKGIPCGAWVATSRDFARVIAFGSDIHEVLEKARQQGESDPIMTRVAAENSTL